MCLQRKLVDYHIHSTQSRDGKSTIFEMCQRAIELGIAQIGFSEHVDFDPADSGFGFFNYQRYTSEIKRAQEFFKKRLVIRKGAEITYQHCFEDDIKEWLQNKKFDFIIGSVHYLDHEIIDYPLIMRKDLRKIYDAYFNEVTRSIESDLFDVVGHFDLIKRYLDDKKPEMKKFHYWENVKAILKEIVEGKMYLEINSKILRDACRDTILSREIVNKYIENGGKLISIGSDAHSTKEIGNGIQEILNFLINCNGNNVKLLFE